MALQAARAPNMWRCFSLRCGARVCPVQCKQWWLSKPWWTQPSAMCHSVGTARAGTACGCSCCHTHPPAPQAAPGYSTSDPCRETSRWSEGPPSPGNCTCCVRYYCLRPSCFILSGAHRAKNS
ncbi:hypothetical protein HJG60_008034 [Phyllostomus discolor]|uniref:Uncharacterized protein n=1 Tax=Phyllostomus discolor TaxID=89673 RepID=A0A834BK16_9CHIR|nr:hypothetical protein HJG60_008034 [Phyllostomus discolor]